MSDLHELKQRIEKATGPDRRLDEEIHCATLDHSPYAKSFGVDVSECGARPTGRGYIQRNVSTIFYTEQTPPFTASLDASLALVERLLPEWSWRAGNRPGGGAWALLGTSRHEHLGATAALALLSALISALIAKGSDHE